MATLTLKPASTFTSPAEITVPGQDAPVTITVTWRHKGRKALKAYMDSATDTVDAEGKVITPAREDLDLLEEVIADWEGLDQPYSHDALAALIEDYHAAARALYATYIRELSGGRRKN